jgi:ATP-dependent DNA helicase RecG
MSSSARPFFVRAPQAPQAPQAPPALPVGPSAAREDGSEPEGDPCAWPPATKTPPHLFAARAPLSREQLARAPVRVPRPSRLQRAPAPQSRRVAAALQALGISSVSDLLEHLPWERREMCRLRDLRPDEPATVAVEVRSIRTRRLRRRGMRPLVEATVFDETAQVRAAFFNQPWLVGRYQPGTELLLHGKLDASGTLRVSSHSPDRGRGIAAAAAVRAPQDARAGCGISHYPASEGVSSTQIASLVRAARGSLADVVEALPARVRRSRALPERASALDALHFSEQPQERELGRSRLAFDELLLGQLLLLRRRAFRRSRSGAVALGEPRALSARWLERALPFTLTADQRAAACEIDADLARACPMQRLLIGDVGSGKTVVALYTMLRAIEHGSQAALMAPTETLAEQHFTTLASLLDGAGVPLALLTSSTPSAKRRGVLAELSAGRPAIVVGTHALIEPAVRFRSLAVAVVDEQHRFGVRQRTRLDEKNGDEQHGAAAPPQPHVLHMSATPIPRTLALAAYGDLDVSALRELPLGRKPVLTRIAASDRARARAYAAMRAQLDAGRQAYVVCPLVSDPDEDEAAEVSTRQELRAASDELERLAGSTLRGYRMALLHGQMPSREKQAAMRAFAAGETQVLVSTTVIEVGIDVQNATVIVVENAERFGISQLHQLRGRVGRGEHRSECILMTSPQSARSRRLRALADHADGFALAEVDLELRGHGELVGTRQSGPVAHRVARLPDDALLLEHARAEAQAIIAADPELRSPEHALLRDELARLFGGESLAPIRP